LIVDSDTLTNWFFISSLISEQFQVKYPSPSNGIGAILNQPVSVTLTFSISKYSKIYSNTPSLKSSSLYKPNYSDYLNRQNEIRPVDIVH
jgi:hypothetical protein